MSSVFLAPRQPLRELGLQKLREGFSGLLPAANGQRVFAGAVGIQGSGRAPFRATPPGNGSDGDRSRIDAALIIALILVSHVAVIDRFKHQPTAPVVKKQLVEIDLLKPPPPPPPPPPVIEPKPEPPKVIEPPKPKPVVAPKPKPKVQPRPKPVPSPLARPALPDVPFADDAPPVPRDIAPPAPPAPPKPVEKTVQITNADYLRPPEPEYPDEAADRGLEGKVTIKARILPDGKPDSVQIQRSSGHASLDQAAIRAVKASLFKPTMRGDAATTVWALIPITFQL